MSALPHRERHLLVLRFVQEKTQSEIGAELFISQMHVSRLLTRTLAQLRREIEHHANPHGPPNGAGRTPSSRDSIAEPHDCTLITHGHITTPSRKSAVRRGPESRGDHEEP
ncbi:sigma-70 family RNA polymerase sigma factor [Actinomycetospora flava]|uniref:Sigma-70 family RNA polymerase sigma factor n=1 Tax=Actinomycetospora flava TaxID=3129232 RepID=A0ABU8MEM9_9PSEU